MLNYRDVDSKQDKRFIKRAGTYFLKLKKEQELKERTSALRLKLNNTINSERFNKDFKSSEFSFKDMNTSDNSGFFITGDPNQTYENSKFESQNDKIVSIDRIATQKTNELLTNLPNLWTNYKTEYVEKGLNKMNAIKFRAPPRK